MPGAANLGRIDAGRDKGLLKGPVWASFLGSCRWHNLSFVLDTPAQEKRSEIPLKLPFILSSKTTWRGHPRVGSRRQKSLAGCPVLSCPVVRGSL